MEDNIYKPAFVKDLFNRMSRTYERMNYITSFGFSIRWRRQFLKYLKGTKHKVEIIDLLTGMGETWDATKRKFPNSTLTVLDFSEGMLQYAIEKSKARFNNEIVVVQQDVLQNQLPANYFDFVTCAFGLKTFNAEQLNVLALETKRILRTNGEFSFVEVSKPNNRLLNTLYGFYLGRIIPILGKLFLGGVEEYKMLWIYTTNFVNAKKASDIFARAGLEVEYTSYFYGCATGFHGKKLSD
jgi:ubiquinone/menaquinone biosynthesis methyltransferase